MRQDHGQPGIPSLHQQVFGVDRQIEEVLELVGQQEDRPVRVSSPAAYRGPRDPPKSVFMQLELG